MAKRFGVSVNSVFLWSKNLEPKLTRNKAPIKIHNDLLIEDIKKYPDAYHYERARRLGVSTAGICRLNVTYKKTLNHPKACKDKRQLFQDKTTAYTKSAQPIIYIDESGFAHDMPRKYGYSLKGERSYSPDLNPIEHKWAQAKLLRRKYNCNIDQLFTHFNL